MSRIKEKVTYPSDWKTKKLGELGTFLKGKGIAKSETKANGLPCIRYGEIYTHHHYYIKEFYSFIDEETAKKSIEIRKGDILFAGSGETMEEIGKSVAFIHDEKAYAGGDIIILRTQGVNSQYLAFALNEGRLAKERAKLGQGHSVVHIYSKELKELVVNLPPDIEQQKIADIISIWDKAIELKEKLIEQKKKQKKGLMQKLLTGEVRLPGFDGEWEEVKLEQVVDRVKGKVIKYSEDGLYPAIDMEYLESGIFRNYTNDDSVLANKNDVLLLWDGSRAGRAFTGMKGSVGSTFVKLTCKRINNIFLQKHLELNEKRIQRLREGSGIPHIPKDFLSIYKIKVPKKQEQEAIAEILLKMDEKIILLRKEAELLKQQKKGLMQLLLTGKVRVKV